MQPRTRPNAFTLVELLVVIGIITVLIAILLPALGAAQDSSKRIQCLSNLRQLSVAAHQYTATNKGSYPPAYYDAVNPPLAYAYSWDFTVVLDTSTGIRTVQPGLLWNGQTNVRVQQCPSFDGPTGTKFDPFTGYNYNTSYIGRDYSPTAAPTIRQRPARVNEVRHSSMTALFGDGEWISASGARTANKYMRAPLPVPDGLAVAPHAGTQGFRHRKQTNVAFCDGHAESLRDCFTANNPNVAPGTGFLSDDNRMYQLN